MTVKDLMLVLDENYGLVIEDVHYITYDAVPEHILDRKVAKIVPEKGLHDAYYLIKLEDV